ncbi:50S ribosomal protein L30 [Fusibacter ferrireducens]|uniref:Large ribosomal subunit protein uL30 n=1 Tax=Fusibacter ferrireducens TaxID=2785058 RepID=A0ABR9ZZE6_9FIRM|nr:50S ribosomal protein L30 [Fusibacter ferrireducens]MBF4695829.1 50S ribosomal protein L30 [Fusibacter ferrireducens]
MATIKVKLVKSTIGVLPKHKKTVEALGLKKIGQVVEKQDNAQMRGMVNQVNHLVQIVE